MNGLAVDTEEAKFPDAFDRRHILLGQPIDTFQILRRPDEFPDPIFLPHESLAVVLQWVFWDINVPCRITELAFHHSPMPWILKFGIPG